MNSQTLSAEPEQTKVSPVARAGHSAVRVPRAVAGLRGLNETDRTMMDSEFLVYLAMVDLADNKTHRLNLDTARIAQRAGVSVRSVQQVLKTGFLVEAGLVERTETPYAVVVVEPTKYNGGYLSIARAALWKSTSSGIDMPAFAVQSLLVLVASGEWSDGTTVTASRHRQTMANSLISLSRFKRGLEYLDTLPWVVLGKQRYDAALAQYGMARRMPTVRTIDWLLLAPYERSERLEAPQEAIEAAPAPVGRPARQNASERLETVPVVPAAVTTSPAVPQQRSARTATIAAAPVPEAPRDTHLLSWVVEKKGIRLADITADTRTANLLIADTQARLDKGWTLEQLRQHCDRMLLKSATPRSPVGWLRGYALPSLNAVVGVLPEVSEQEIKHRASQAARERTWDIKQAAMSEARGNTILDESSPF